MNAIKSGFVLLAFSWNTHLAHAEELGAEPLDLSKFYGRVSGTEGDTWFSHRDWNIVPKGLQEFDGILFDVSGNMLFQSTNMAQLQKEVQGIPVGRKGKFIHFLHGGGYAEEDGVVVAHLDLVYENETKKSLPIKYGVHFRNWWKEKTEHKSKLEDPGSGVAWSGQGDFPPKQYASVPLFRTSFQNPMPDMKIKSLSIRSTNSKAILCVVSINVGNDAPKVIKTESGIE